MLTGAAGGFRRRSPGTTDRQSDIGKIGLDEAKVLQETLVGGQRLETLNGHVEQPDRVTTGTLHSCGSTDRNKSCVSGCQHQRRLRAKSPEASEPQAEPGAR